ncbi:transcription factor Ouib [Scaptodrosophila lebanonensis]|uniref:Transcription factor Ouib n=1 Tax=Drosophila lebanonensis TaxID=7225 RepID=A0A6J2T742_DROLE|nr:transcription factor Ouib [Scaptodrosophila lebanonensis]
MSDHCRTCGKFIYCGDRRNLFEQPDKIMLHQIETLTGLMLLHHADSPVHICGPCEVALRLAIGFRETIIKTQQILQNCDNVAEALLKLHSNELDFEALDGNEDYEEDAYDSPSNDAEMSYELQPGDGDKTEIHEHNDDVDECFSTAEELATSDTISAEQNMPSEMPTKTAVISDENAIRKSRKHSNTVYASVNFADNTKVMPRTDWSKLTEEEVVALKRERRKRDCICEQCGRHFSCPSNFKVHLLRHSGVKNYFCKLCPMKFYTAHLLRRHEMLHVCDRPYACQYCDQRFSHYSGRIQHERNRHTNYKPFKCSECDKAFAVSGKLKAHMLRHTGVRAFHCEVCSMSFMRKTHLVAHFRSKGHKQNVGKVESDVFNTDIETPVSS